MMDTNQPQIKSDLAHFPQHIFRAYDIRGVVTNELTETVVHDIGAALGSEVISHGGDHVVVARDGRISGPKLVAALIEGICSTGCHVLDIGVVPTPVLYFATYTTGITSGVMLTGSHNPVDYNGLKMVVAGRSLYDDSIQRLYWRIKMGDLRQGQGTVTQQNLLPDYFTHIQNTVQINQPLKVVVDAGNGVGGVTAPTLLTKLGCDVVPMYCEIDGTFPNHHPDPSKPENLAELIERVKQENADIGLAFDGDADRVGVVTPKGKIIWPDRQIMLFVKHICPQFPGAPIVYDVKCSRYVAEIIKASGGEPMMFKTGHSVIKNKMKAIHAPFAGEMSGHIFFNDKWFGFDDGVYSAVRLLEILSGTQQDLDGLFSDIPEAIATPELNISIDDNRKFGFIDQLVINANFSNAEIIDIDGIRVEFSDGWGLVRASNTTPNLVVRFEADTEQALQRIQKEFHDFIAENGPDLILPF